jgi:hypothetical protein
MSPSPLRRFLESRVQQLLTDAEKLESESRMRAVREFTGRLNQAVRRIRQAETLAGLGETLVDCAAGFAAGAALFTVNSRTVRLESIRGVDTETLPAHLEVPLASVPALAGALETLDPVRAAAVAAEVSSALVELLGHVAGECVSIFPLVTREPDAVPAVLYCWGEVDESALELLAQSAAAEWSALATSPPGPAQPLVSIATASTPSPNEAAAYSWESLSQEEQAVHLRAQRFARVQVSQLRLAEAEAVQSGRAHRDLYGRLRTPIDEARRAFREQFFTATPGMLDYLHLELVRTLANENAELLGPDYPGPMV